MKRLVLSSLALALFAAPAWADAWTGGYVGVNIGHGWARSGSTIAFSDPTAGGLLSSGSANFTLDSLIGGGQLGYNLRVGNWLFGFEADIQASGQQGNTSGACSGGTLASGGTFNGACTPGHLGDTAPFNVPAFPVAHFLSQKIDWFGTVRGRVGSTITPSLLVYVTGGLAYGQVDSTSTVSGTNIFGAQGTNTFTLVPAAVAFGSRTTKTGWTLGGGIEGLLGGNWTGKIEYLYLDLGTVSGAFVTPIVTTTGGFLSSSFSSQITNHILRVGLNYRFGYSAGSP